MSITIGRFASDLKMAEAKVVVALRLTATCWRLPITRQRRTGSQGTIMCEEEIDADDEIESLREYLEGKIGEKFEELEKKLLLRFREESYCRICQKAAADTGDFDPVLSEAEILFHRAAHCGNRREAASICRWSDVERLANLNK